MDCWNPFSYCMDLYSVEQGALGIIDERTPLVCTEPTPSPSMSTTTRTEEGGVGVLLLDGEGDMFDPLLISSGYSGGQLAASSLSSLLLSHLSSQLDQPPIEKLVCYYILSNEGRTTSLARARGMGEELDQFLKGLNTSKLLKVFVIDASGTRDGDKLAELLDHHTSSAINTGLILLGGLHSSRNAALLDLLRRSTSPTTTKILLVETISVAPMYREMIEKGEIKMTDAVKELFGGTTVNLRRLREQSEDSVMTKADVKQEDEPEGKKKSKKQWSGGKGKNVDRTSSPSPTSDTTEVSSMSTPFTMVSRPRSRTKGSTSVRRASTSSAVPIVRPLSRSVTSLSEPSRISLKFKDPKPCNEHYLSPRGCRSGSSCPYSHDYPFTQEEWELYPAFLKSQPCKMAASGTCPYGDECTFGHHCPHLYDDCPHGERCFFYNKGMPHVDTRK